MSEAVSVMVDTAHEIVAAFVDAITGKLTRMRMMEAFGVMSLSSARVVGQVGNSPVMMHFFRVGVSHTIVLIVGRGPLVPGEFTGIVVGVRCFGVTGRPFILQIGVREFAIDSDIPADDLPGLG